ncbi:cyclic nucleotide-binding domain-containing protein [uncultured Tateyamaria sp.]|uniref:Crp/Fnr family transcriptional regulator n=1 Tax=uncultured Tateyamaria sp. TaxID=455651 RepID=UPI002624CFE6|nr:cyclic nucleotide-binding domain-containing protein [uncultured Tateyamaria sp.]
MIDYYLVAGYGGVAFYLGSYGLLQLGVLKGNSYTYAAMNLMAAALVLVSLFRNWNLFSAIIQISWITLSVVGIARVWVMSNMLRFSDEEQELLKTRFPALRAIEAKKLMDAGTWHNGDAGDALTQQGEPVEALTYLAEGGVDIDVGGQIIAQVGPGQFIGEMACMTSGPASASVRLNQPTRFFSAPSDALRRLVRRNPDIAPHLDLAFSGNIRSKLMATNTVLEQTMKARETVPAPD